MDMYKVQAEKDGNYLICKKWNDVHEYLGDEPMLVTLVEMTEQEYNALPKFDGF